MQLFTPIQMKRWPFLGWAVRCLVTTCVGLNGKNTRPAATLSKSRELVNLTDNILYLVTASVFDDSVSHVFISLVGWCSTILRPRTTNKIDLQD